MSFRPQADRAAKRQFSRHVDRMRFIRQMAAEANFGDPTSPAGAQGPAQIMPATARSWGVRNVHDPNQAYGAAASHMAQYLKAYHGSWAKALTAYNAGPGAVGKGLPGETRAYIQKVLGAGDAKAGAVGGGAMPGDTIRPFGTKLSNQTSFDAKGYEQAKKMSIVGSLIARNRGTDSPLFKTGLLTTSAPSPQDFMHTVLSSRMTRGKAVNLAPGIDGGGGPAPQGMLATAKAFDSHHTAYLWGGGHGGIAKPSDRVDCSGFVSAVLGLKTPMTSGAMARQLKPGRGKGYTVYANDGHVIIQIGNRFFGTSHSNPGGGPGEIPNPGKAYLSKFKAVHK